MFTNAKLSILFNLETEITNFVNVKAILQQYAALEASLLVSFMKRGNYSQYSVEILKKTTLALSEPVWILL